MSGPSVPNAKSVADQALQYGIKAGTAQNELNQVNQVTPTGSLTYRPVMSPVVPKLDKMGRKIVGPNGKILTTGGKPVFNADGTPKTQAITKLNPAQQALLNAQTATNTAGAGAACNIIGANAGKWAAGPDLGPMADETGITKAIMGWGHDYLQPVFDSQNASADAKLANQGIAPGSEAWTNAHRDTARNQNDAYTQLLLQGQGQALSAQAQNMQRGEMAYMDPLRAISTLSTGAQPSVQFAQTPQAGVQAPDYTTAANNQYNAKKANSDALMGGLFKIPQTILGGWASGGL